MAELPPAAILITGATDGIGLAMARLWAQQGWRQRPARLILVGRKALADLDAAFFNADNYCQADLSRPHAPVQIAQWLDAQEIGRLDLLVHNAGVGYVGDTGAQSATNVRQLIAVNLEAPLALTHQLLNRMTPTGKIVFISSVASALPGPDYAVYTATKSALNGFVRNLRIELAAAPATRTMEVQLILPGAINTGMHAKSGATLDRMNWQRFPPADQVAAQIAAVIEGPRATATIGGLNRVVRFAGQNLSPLVDGAMRRTQKRAAAAPARLPEAPPHCVITGAADGIGRALALRLASAGFRITGLDFDAERANQTRQELTAAGGTIEFVQVDLANQDALDAALQTLRAGPAVDLLIHNAGINAVGHFAHMEWPPQQMVLAVNLVAPLLLTRGLLAANHLNAGGTVVCISSLSRFVGYPGAAVYAASKDGLASYARSLSVALAGQNINVLTVYPGPTRTAHARRYSPDNSREARRMAPAELAQRIVAAVEKRQRTLIPGAGNQLFAVAGHLAPRVTERVMKRAILDKVKG
ncbi:MAG: SDR family NAD(P)-dependent oxidoreductase [Caldilineaceae bacterium]|nr:SDR family NAD(P)-dependent oxidoreductase [Caldilineaceae bacterium]